MRRDRLHGLLAIVSLAVLSAGATAKDAPTRRSTKKPAWPEFSQVVEIVERRLAADRNYRPGDLISRGDTTPIFDELAERGWKVKDRREIELALLADSDFLVRDLQTPAGRAFMRQVGRYPEGYDRLDRLAGLTDGQLIIGRLINGPDGYKLLEYFTTAPGGTAMGNMLSNVPHGAHFNQPTGRIYTADALVARLKSSYAAAEKERAKAPVKRKRKQPKVITNP